MRLSVIVPTRNRAGSLKKLLQSLHEVECPGSLELEVLVVDNGSTDGTQEMIAGELPGRRRFSLRVLNELTKGKASALNLGLASAKGEFLLVLDDDVVVHAQFLAKHLECYEATDFDAVQGRVLPGLDPEGKPADLGRLREYNIPWNDYGDDYREIRGLTGTNMSFKRRVFEKVGFFDTRLGPGAAGFSEDSEYSIRIRHAGFKIGYTPHAVVYHELNPERYGRKYNRAVEYRKGVSRSLYRRDSILLGVIPNLIANCLRYGLYRLAGQSQKAYRTEGRIMKCWGYLMGRTRGASSPDTHRNM
ncbi:MAG TPA: glycosyltransferase [Candidatus Binatia bacterium]|nr:glycosyltransferase [Candidatus Binatia bacterium]